MAAAAPQVRTKATSLRMPASMADGYVSAYTAIYGKRGATRWIEEALAQLLKHPSFVTKIGAGENQEFDTKAYVGLTPLAQTLVEDAIRRYRRVDPLTNHLHSMILRAAIRLRLETDKVQPSPSRVPDLAPVAEISPGRLRRRKQA